MIKEDIELENEMDSPENWVSNRVLVRDGRGKVVELTDSDNEGGDADA